MTLSASNFNVVGASQADLNSLNSALAYLGTSSTGSATMQAAAAEGVTINIVHNGADQYHSDTNTIDWDPYSALAVQDPTDNEGTVGIQSAALGLGHEATHANDYATNPNQYNQDVNTPNSEYQNNEEENAVNNEDAIAAQLGEPLRYNHDGDLVSEADTTAHTTTTTNGNGEYTWVSGSTGQTLGVYEPGSVPDQAPTNGGDTGADRTLTVNGQGVTVSPEDGDNVVVDASLTAINTRSSTITTNPDLQVSVIGTNDIVDGGAGDNIGVHGGANTVNGSADDNIYVTGTNGQADNIFASNLNSGQTAAGSASAISLDNNAQINLWGSSDNFNLGSGDTLTTEVAGSYALTFNASGDNLNLAANTSFTLNGNQDGINLGSGDFATLNTANSSIDAAGGINLAVTGGGNTFNLGATSGAADEINGVYETYDASNNVDVDLWGSGNSLNLDQDDKATLNDGGGYNVTSDANGNNANYVYVTNGVEATFSDPVSTTWVDVQGTGDTIGVNEAGTIDNDYVVDVSNNLSGDVINVSDGVVYGGSSDDFTVSGSDDTIQADYSNDISVNGFDDSVTAFDSNIDFSDGSDDDHITGSGDTEEGWDDDGGDDGGYGGYGGYGYAGYGFAAKKAPSGSSIGSIAAYDTAQGDQRDAFVAQAARLQAEAVGTANAASSTLLGAKWNKTTITWTMNVGTGSSSPFSSQVGAQYQTAIEQAIATWAHASGLNFDLVSNPANAMLKVGFATLDTADTGVLGYTALKASGGQISAGSILLEDPTEDALTTDASGQLAYSGTGAELEQLALHEIGHALGLADSADPNSIMAPTLTSANETLDAQDISNIQSLYSSSTTSSSLSSDTVLQSINSNLLAQSQQLIQAMAGLQSVSGTLSAFTLPTTLTQPALITAGH